LLLRLAGKAVAVVKGLEAAETFLQVSAAGYQAVKAVELYLAGDLSEAYAKALEATLRLLGITPKFIKRLPTVPAKHPKQLAESARKHLIDVAGPPVDPKSLTGPNRGIFTTTEKPAMSPSALDYQSSLPGAVTDMTTRKPIVPGIRYDNPNLRGKNYILFDGLDPYDSTTLVDRKLGIARSPKQKETFLRWAEALEQNPGIKIRIEVPNRKVWREVEKFINNIGVDPKVRERISVVEVPIG
jgi:hypothetical protein